MRTTRSVRSRGIANRIGSQGLTKSDFDTWPKILGGDRGGSFVRALLDCTAKQALSPLASTGTSQAFRRPILRVLRLVTRRFVFYHGTHRTHRKGCLAHRCEFPTAKLLLSGLHSRVSILGLALAGLRSRSNRNARVGAPCYGSPMLRWETQQRKNPQNTRDCGLLTGVYFL